MNYEYWLDLRDFYLEIGERWNKFLSHILFHLAKNKGIQIQIGDLDVNKEIKEIELKLKEEREK